MTAVLDRPAPGGAATPPPIDLSPRRGWRFTKNTIMTGLMILTLFLALVPLVAVLFTLLSKGLAAMGWSFLTQDTPIQSRRPGGGIYPAIVGTLLITGAATLMAVPLGILGAIYLTEYGAVGPLARLVRFMANVMTGVPSIVMGLLVYLIWTLNFGLSAFGGALALSFLMLPVVIRSTEEMLKLVPDALREGSYALGTTKSRTILTVVLPSALPGVVSGALLAVARAAGETAPLLFTIGVVTSPNFSLFNGANTALSPLIFRNATSPFAAAQERAWGAALTLVALTFLLTLVARLVSARFATKR